MKIEQNVGKKDQQIRFAAAAITALLAIVIGGPVGSILAFIFIVLVITGAAGFCPAYMIFGLNTGAADKEQKGACCGGGSCDDEKEDNKPSGGCCGGMDSKDDDKAA